MAKLNQKARAFLREKGFSDAQIDSGEWQDTMNLSDDFAEVEESESIQYPSSQGILTGLSNDDYHLGPGVSKSALWKLYKKTPAHMAGEVRKETAAFDLGSAAHLAILEPEKFEADVLRGPIDRRGNKWKDLKAHADIEGKLLLTSGDYDHCLTMRDNVHSNERIHAIITNKNALVENSAYWVDPETDTLCRCRPDLVRPDLGIHLDLKTSKNADEWSFARDMADYGYHAQEAFYSDGWFAAGGCKIEGMVFLVVEKEPPFEFRVYELKPSAVEEGRAAMRVALNEYAQCSTNNAWPGYSKDVQEIDIPAWAYKLTDQAA